MNTPQPTVAVMAGINGAGKTTASQRILREFLRMPTFVNADTIARGLNAFDPESEAVKAGRIMLDHLKDLASGRRSFSFETTLAARTYAPWLGELRQGGYVVHLFYYWLRSPDQTCRRSGPGWRASRSGRDHPAALLAERSELPGTLPAGGDDVAGV
jgi:predicted ABC-type ATPase